MPEGRTFAAPGTDAGPTLDELRDAGSGLPSRSAAERYLLRTRGRTSEYEPAMWAFALNRLTGVLLLVYLIFHILALLFVAGVYETSAPGHWVVLVVDVAAVGAVTYHGLNGLRLVLGDLGLLARRRQHVRFIWLTAALALFATIGAIVRVVTF